MINIRHAAFEDMPDIAAIHVKSWQSAYRGIVQQAFLDAMDVNQRKNRWEENFKNLSADNHLFVATENGQITGFIAFGKARDENIEDHAEIYGLIPPT